MSAFYPQVINNHISAHEAAGFTGYNIQYLRRLLRAGKLSGTKIGQVWLIQLASLEAYFRERGSSSDRRCGPKSALVDETTSDKRIFVLLTSCSNLARILQYCAEMSVYEHKR